MADPAPAFRARDDSWVDEAIAPFTFFVDAMATASTALIPGSEHVQTLWVERLELMLPFEMDVLVEDDGKVRLAGGPPTQYTETSVMPVFHSIRMSVVGDISLAGDSKP